ncbi:MAG: hypothetical protein PHP52_02295 [Bacteroidales bacterium]|nr:hypothetical protein [Bacteroidales bacterium]MDD4216003.1 hypothetical protein [Bacteroidales bacterium]
MKNKITILTIVLFLHSFIGFSQKDSTPISKYQEFALFITGQEFPVSNTDTTIDRAFWIDYQSKINEDWPSMDSSRLTPMRDWSNEVIKPQINDSLTLFYPFSGPDFLHAHVLFPNASNYLFLAQEQLGEIPNISKASERELSDYLDKFYYSIRDIYKRSYFITGRMNTDLHNASIKGVLPVIIFFMSQTEHEIHDIKYETLDVNGDFKEFKSITGRFSATECVTISFSEANSEKVKTLRYFRCDISDSGFAATPVFKSYLDKLDTVNTYVKSASYLLHYGTFNIIRNIILDNSEAVLQDDTGIPLKYYQPEIWTAKLFGVYVKPISDFTSPYLMQSDLKAIYDKGEDIDTLPFSLGYHWRTGEQNQMFFIRIKPE